MKKTVLSLLVSASVMLSLNALAAEPLSKEQEFEAKVNALGLYQSYGGVQVINNLDEVGLNDMYEVKIGGRESGLMPSTGTHFITGRGELVLFTKEGNRNITAENNEKRLKETAMKEIPAIDSKSEIFITYNQKDGVEKLGTLYVFTDTTCGFCVKLHNEIDQLLAAGVQVKYLPYPRSGADEKIPVSQNPDGSYKYGENTSLTHLAQIMCAKDKETALTEFKRQTAGLKYDNADYQANKAKCIDYVKQGYDLGQKIGFGGTPFLYLSTGEVVPGYNPAAQLIEKFKAAKK